MEGSLEEDIPSGWERASARVLKRHIRRPDPGRWMMACCHLRVQGSEVQWYTSWEEAGAENVDRSRGLMDRKDPMSSILWRFEWMPSTVFTRTLRGKYYYYLHVTTGRLLLRKARWPAQGHTADSRPGTQTPGFADHTDSPVPPQEMGGRGPRSGPPEDPHLPAVDPGGRLSQFWLHRPRLLPRSGPRGGAGLALLREVQDEDPQRHRKAHSGSGRSNQGSGGRSGKGGAQGG